MRLYRPDYIADLVSQTSDRRERAKIARAGGYTIKFIEGILSKRRNEDVEEYGDSSIKKNGMADWIFSRPFCIIIGIEEKRLF